MSRIAETPRSAHCQWPAPLPASWTCESGLAAVRDVAAAEEVLRRARAAYAATVGNPRIVAMAIAAGPGAGTTAWLTCEKALASLVWWAGHRIRPDPPRGRGGSGPAPPSTRRGAFALLAKSAALALRQTPGRRGGGSDAVGRAGARGVL